MHVLGLPNSTRTLHVLLLYKLRKRQTARKREKEEERGSVRMCVSACVCNRRERSKLEGGYFGW
jgi:hypothetical protein